MSFLLRLSLDKKGSVLARESPPFLAVLLRLDKKGTESSVSCGAELLDDVEVALDSMAKNSDSDMGHVFDSMHTGAAQHMFHRLRTHDIEGSRKNRR